MLTEAEKGVTLIFIKKIPDLVRGGYATYIGIESHENNVSTVVT